MKSTSVLEIQKPRGALFQVVQILSNQSLIMKCFKSLHGVTLMLVIWWSKIMKGLMWWVDTWEHPFMMTLAMRRIHTLLMIGGGGVIPTPKDPIRIIGAKVKKTKVETIIVTTTTATTMLIGVDIATEIEPKIKMVIRYGEITTKIRWIGKNGLYLSPDNHDSRRRNLRIKEMFIKPPKKDDA